MIQYLRHCVSMAALVAIFLSYASIRLVYRQYFKNFLAADPEENDRLSQQHSEYEDKLREEATKQAQERDSTLKRGSPHPPRKKS